MTIIFLNVISHIKTKKVTTDYDGFDTLNYKHYYLMLSAINRLIILQYDHFITICIVNIDFQMD